MGVVQRYRICRLWVGSREIVIGNLGFCDQFGKRRDVLVTLQEGCYRTEMGQRFLVERPDRVIDRRPVGVDQERTSRSVTVAVKARDVDLSDRVKGKRFEHRDRVAVVVDCADVEVIDIEQ
ncbi:MAG: hypothetical protein WHS85_03280 [Hydrogenophilus sp.]